MALDASVALSVQDNLSAAVVAMKNNMTAFRTDVVELQKELYTLNNSKANLRIDMSAAQLQLKKTKQAFQELGEEASDAERKAAEADWHQAEENLENIRQQYELVSKQVRQTTKDFEQASGALSRADNRAGTASQGGILSALGQAGAWSMLGDVAGQWAGTLVSSAGGQEAGTLFSSALSGAGVGAAIGNMIVPGAGAVVGGALGGLVGLVSGGTQVYEQKDDAFKEYYQQLYEQGQTAAEESLSAGSETASQRELDAIAFNRLLGDGVGTSYLSDLRTLAADTPMEYGDLTNMSRALATGFGDDTDRMLELMTAIGDAGSAVGVDASGMTYMSQMLSRMQSSGKVGLEELNAFQDRGIDVIGMLSEALDKTQGQIYDMISEGQIGGSQAVNILQSGLEEQFGGAMETMAGTFSGLTSTLEDVMADIDAARGEEFNETRKSGLEAEAEAYGGALGNEIANLNRISGQNEAYMENLSDQYMREALGAVLLGQDTSLYSPEQQEKLSAMAAEYNEAKLEADRYGSQDARLTMENLYREAQSLATTVYENSEVYQNVQNAEQDLIAAIRENTAAWGNSAWMAPYRIMQELSKGQASVGLSSGSAVSTGTRKSNSNYHRAFGLPQVPYDNYPALLHEGERVLTAREARAADSTPGRSIQITITGNNFGAGTSAEEIAQRLADALEVKLAAGVLQ